MLERLLLVFAAGGLGTVTRYGLTILVHRQVQTGFPLGILVVNATGCLFFGLVYALIEERGILSPQVRLAVLVGFAGAFTTFSTFAFDTAQLARSSQMLWAAGNIILNVTLGIALIFAGFALGRSL